MTDPLIASIAKLECKAGDTVVIQASCRLTIEQVRAIREYAAKALPDGVRAMVMDAQLSVSHVIAADGV